MKASTIALASLTLAFSLTCFAFGDVPAVSKGAVVYLSVSSVAAIIQAVLALSLVGGYLVLRSSVTSASGDIDKASLAELNAKLEKVRTIINKVCSMVPVLWVYLALVANSLLLAAALYLNVSHALGAWQLLLVIFSYTVTTVFNTWVRAAATM